MKNLLPQSRLDDNHYARRVKNKDVNKNFDAHELTAMRDDPGWFLDRLKRMARYAEMVARKEELCSVK